MKPAIGIKHKPDYRVDYIRRVLRHDSVAKLLPLCVRVLKTFEFDAIAFRGVSGALLGAPLSYLTGKPMIVVRKPSESSHAVLTVEGDRGARTYVIVDDFIESGRTARIIREEIEKFSGARCIGALCADEVLNHFEAHGSRSHEPFTLALVG